MTTAIIKNNAVIGTLANERSRFTVTLDADFVHPVSSDIVFQSGTQYELRIGGHIPPEYTLAKVQYQTTDKPGERYTSSFGEMTVQSDGSVVRTQQWTEMPPLTPEEAAANAIANCHAKRDELIAKAFERAGLTQPPHEILDNTTRRFVELVAKKTNGGMTPTEGMEFEAIKAFNDDWVRPVEAERDRQIGLIAQGQTPAPNWPEFTDAHLAELQTIIAIQLNLL